MNKICGNCKNFEKSLVSTIAGQCKAVNPPWWIKVDRHTNPANFASPCTSFQEITLDDVCFSCRSFIWEPMLEKPSHGCCPKWAGAWFDGLTSRKCNGYKSKYGYYLGIRVIKFPPREEIKT